MNMPDEVPYFYLDFLNKTKKNKKGKTIHRIK